MIVYCDESGYTGVDLLESSQPYFVYSGVQLTNSIKDEIEGFLRANYKIQASEFKGKNLLNSGQGKKVLIELFKKYSQYARIVYHDKKYALACKIVEYGIEPYLSSNVIFYTSKFHLFLASMFYASFITKEESAELLFSEFLLIIRGKKKITDSTFQSVSVDNPILEWAFKIILSKPPVIIDEVLSKEGKGEKWILDLTMTSLLTILTDFSKNNEELVVICDNSKVFVDNPVVESFTAMGLVNNRADILGVKVGFNLKKELTFADSKEYVGLQIADLFSSTVFHCLKNHNSEFSKKIMVYVRRNCLCTPHSSCVLPDFKSQKKEFMKKKILYCQLMDSIFNEVSENNFLTQA